MNPAIGVPAHPGAAEPPATSNGLNNHTHPAPQSREHKGQQDQQHDGHDRYNPGWTWNDSKTARAGMGLLLGLVALGVAAILLAPVALSSRDLLDWAAAPSGLGLPVFANWRHGIAPAAPFGPGLVHPAHVPDRTRRPRSRPTPRPDLDR